MKLLELYINKTAPHHFICVDGFSRTQMEFSSSDSNVMLAEALRIIEADEAFEDRIRVYDAHGICLKGDVTRWVQRSSLKRWMQPSKEPIAA